MSPGTTTRTIRTILFGLLAVASYARAQDVSVEATVNAERIGVEDVLELTVSISGGDARGEPVLPDLPGFRVAGRSTSSQIQIVNGRMSSTNAYIYQLLPQKEGKFAIGPVSVEAEGKTYRTDPIEVEVVSGSVVSRRPRGMANPFDPFGNFPSRQRRTPELQDDDVFVRAEISNATPYQGEQVVLTYRLYSRYVPLGPEIADDPPLSGFWVEEVDLGREPKVERRTIDGKQYITFPIKQRVVFPTRSGKLDVPPITFSMAFRLTSGDPFDAFFSRASSPVNVRSQPVTLDVKPLPEAGRSADFEGAVGQYEIAATLNKGEVAAGDAVTLTLRIEGKGNLRSVEPPKLPELSGFRAFDPKTDETAKAGSSGLEGRKSWEYVLVPQSSGVKEIGPWRFEFFDPSQKKYVTASAGPLDLRVTGDAAAAAGGPATNPSPKGEITMLRQDIRFLKEPPDRLGEQVRPFYRSPLFLGSVVLPVLWNLGLVTYLKRREKERTHSSLFRSRRAHRMARERLRKAEKLASAASRDFYEEIAQALYRYVGDKASTSPSGLTTASIDQILEERSVPEELRAEFRSLLDQCEEARFTPGARTREDMEALRSRSEELIVFIERHWSK